MGGFRKPDPTPYPTFSAPPPPPPPAPRRTRHGGWPPPVEAVEPLDRVVRVTYADGRVRYRVTSASGTRVLAWDWGGVVTFRFAWTARRALRRHQREQESRTIIRKEVIS